MTEKEKMLSGQVYSAVDAELLRELGEVRETVHRYNALEPSHEAERLSILKGLLGAIGAGSVVTHDIPSDVVAVGNPCKVLRSVLPA